MMRLKRFFLGILIGLIATCGGWLLLVELQLGGATVSSQWAEDVLKKKIEIANLSNQKNKKTRIFVVGGSNVLYGIDAKKMSESLGVETINYGLSAVMSANKVISEVKPHLRKGDVVVLAMEYSYYPVSYRRGDVELDYMMAHDIETFHQIALAERLKMMLSVGIFRLIEGLWTVMLSGDENPYDGTYALPTIDSFGDERKNDIRTVPQGFKDLIKSLRPVKNAMGNDDFWILCKDFLAWSKARGIKVYATFPAYLYFDVYLQPNEIFFYSQAVTRFNAIEIPTLGNPFMFMYPPLEMYDTRYHLNSQGREKRTQTMIELLLPKLQIKG